MGDILHALPAVTALSMAHPAWTSTGWSEPRWRALLAAEGSTGRQSGPGSSQKQSAPPASPQPVVDRLHLAATKEWRKAPFSRHTLHEITSFARRAQGWRIRCRDRPAGGDPVGGGGAAGWMQPGDRRGGTAGTGGALAVYRAVVTHGAHVIEQDVELVSAIAGDELTPVRPWLPVDSAAEAWADDLFSLSNRAARRAHQPRRRLGRQALACRTLRRSCTGT